LWCVGRIGFAYLCDAERDSFAYLCNFEQQVAKSVD
jgi:hypothetical protein